MADVTSVYDLDITQLLSKMDKVAQVFSEADAQFKKLENDPFKEAAQGAGKLEKELSDNTKKVVELDAVTAAYKEEVKRLNTELRTQESQLKKLASAAKYNQNRKEVEALKNEVKKLNTEIANTTKVSQKATTMLSRIKGGFMGAFTGLAAGGGPATQGVAAALGAINPVLGVTAGLIGGLASKAFEATAQWQGYEVALKNSLGSQELANKNLSVLEELAVRLPVGLSEVTESFSQLVNRGFKPTKDELSNLSGFAAAQNKTFDQLIQAILDSEQGELERLKEFGIQAKNEGGKVSITFRGITKTFEKGAKDSATAFADLARELGSDKLNADKMQTLEGRMSNLADQSDRVSRKFGELLLPVFEKLLGLSSSFLDFIDKSVTGWGKFDDTLTKVSKTGSENAYPTFQKLFNLFSGEKADEGINKWELFFFSLNAGIERVMLNAEALVGLLANLNNPAGIGAVLAQRQINNENVNKAVRRFFIDQRRTRRRGTDSGELEYGPGTPNAPAGPTAEELKLMQKRATELAELERKLSDELLKIENEFGKEKLEALKDNELQYIEAKKKYDLLKIDQEEKALLRLKQIVSGARKGQYDRNGKVIADTSATLSDTERAPFDFRRDLVNSEAYKDQAKFINDAEKEITKILSTEYQNQLQATERKYEELFKLAEKSGQDIAKLEKQKQKELNKIELDNETAKLEKQANANIGGSELDVIQAQIDGRLDLELQARKQMLEIEKMYNIEKIKLIEQYGTEEEKERILPILKANKEIEKSINDLEYSIKAMKFDPNTLITQLFGEKGGEAFKDASKSIISSISEVYSTQERLVQQRISRIEDEINKKEEQVQKETELNEEGVANNLALRQKELADLKAARERALEDQKRLQRTQLLIDTASQASAMITAASKVFSGFATIPVVGVGLGIAAVALMLGAFAAAKIKSFQLVNQQTPQFKDGGRHKGRRHSEGGINVEVEDGEWTINRKASEEYNNLLEAINSNNKAGVMDYLLSELLDGTGVTMSDKERRREMNYMSYYQKQLTAKENDSFEELKLIRAELAEIKKSTSNIPHYTTTSLGDGKVLKENVKGNNTSVVDFKEMIKK